jgi:hypothetical protein
VHACTLVGIPPSSFLDLPSPGPSLDALPVASPVLAVLGAWLSYVSASTPARFARVLPGPEDPQETMYGRLTFDSCWPFPSCRSVEMKGAKAFVACLVLALLAGRASAKKCKIKKKQNKLCSYYSETFEMQLSLTQACVSSDDIFDSTNKYYPQSQPWWNVPQATYSQFLKEVKSNCVFGYPNAEQKFKTASPYVCPSFGTAGADGDGCVIYNCYGITKKSVIWGDGDDSCNKCNTTPSKKLCKALLSALN